MLCTLQYWQINVYCIESTHVQYMQGSQPSEYPGKIISIQPTIFLGVVLTGTPYVQPFTMMGFDDGDDDDGSFGQDELCAPVTEWASLQNMQ